MKNKVILALLGLTKAADSLAQTTDADWDEMNAFDTVADQFAQQETAA